MHYPVVSIKCNILDTGTGEVISSNSSFTVVLDGNQSKLVKFHTIVSKFISYVKSSIQNYSQGVTLTVHISLVKTKTLPVPLDLF